MPAKKYTDDQIATAAEMREAGKSLEQIARTLGMSSGAVYWHCLRQGADTPKPGPSAKTGPASYTTRTGRTVRRFTESEDRQIVEMDRSGSSISDIARALGRKHNSIIGRMMALARNEERYAVFGEAG